MESSDDGRPSAFDRVIGFFLVVFVIEGGPDLFSPFWKLGRVIGPETACTEF